MESRETRVNYVIKVWTTAIFGSSLILGTLSGALSGTFWGFIVSFGGTVLFSFACSILTALAAPHIIAPLPKWFPNDPERHIASVLIALLLCILNIVAVILIIGYYFDNNVLKYWQVIAVCCVPFPLCTVYAALRYFPKTINMEEKTNILA